MMMGGFALNAPERIWADGDATGGKRHVDWDWDSGCWGHQQERDGETEYIRADLVPQWQPIETAPKDGTNVDLWGVNHLNWNKSGERITNISWGIVSDWLGREREDWQHGRGEDFEPTHWMPQPTPPHPTARHST